MLSTHKLKMEDSASGPNLHGRAPAIQDPVMVLSLSRLAERRADLLPTLHYSSEVPNVLH
jgi:hypothetical protein